MVEFAFIPTFLLMLGPGGLRIRDGGRRLDLGDPRPQEGARVAASAANHEAADWVILEATVGASQSARSGQIQLTHIFRSDENGMAHRVPLVVGLGELEPQLGVQDRSAARRLSS